MSNGGANDGPSGLAKWLAGGLTLFSGVAATVGVSTGTLQHLALNRPTTFFTLFTLAVLAVGVGILLPALWPSRSSDKWLAPGAVVLLGAMLGLGWFAIRDTGTPRRPTAHVALSATADVVTLKGQVEARGLKAKEYVVVTVEGRSSRVKLAKRIASKRRRGEVRARRDGHEYGHVVYVARVGPDDDGKVEAPIELAVRRKIYTRLVVSAELQGEDRPDQQIGPSQRRCDASTNYWTCAAVLVP